MAYAILSAIYIFFSKHENPNWETRFIHLPKRNIRIHWFYKKKFRLRIERHLSKDNNLHWHVDYLLANEKTKITKVKKSVLSECDLNTDVKGKIIVTGFGSSDCKENCKVI